jgi:hypothetical protein
VAIPRPVGGRDNDLFVADEVFLPDQARLN